MRKILIIQTAFIGDVVLATGIIEKLHAYFPQAQIGFLVRKGNEALLTGHPYLHQVLIWDKKEGKMKNLLRMLRTIRAARYDAVINVQRFAATGILTAFSGAKRRIGFDKNPFSRLFTDRIPHVISGGTGTQHEIMRNQALIRSLTDERPAMPRLYPSARDREAIAGYQHQPYITISPASVWFTKQYPKEKWISFLNKLPASFAIYILGAPGDTALAEEIRSLTSHTSAVNLCGQLSFLQSTALMEKAHMNYVNDSAPMHFASAVNAPVTAIYCSTLPSFGFGPLSDRRFVVELTQPLYCRPCGLHGRVACPEGHFKCAFDIGDEQLLQTL